MCKPLFITLPCVLLLLDFWPLRRVAGDVVSTQSSVSPGRLFLEKLPLFALSIASGMIMIAAHHEIGIIISSAELPFVERGCECDCQLLGYFRKLFWPDDLSFFYRFPDRIPLSLFLRGARLFLSSSIAAAFWMRKRPYFFVGWFWFVGTLIPFIGLVQVNDQAMADRFVYVPLIGLLIAIIWELRSAF